MPLTIHLEKKEIIFSCENKQSRPAEQSAIATMCANFLQRPRKLPKVLKIKEKKHFAAEEVNRNHLSFGDEGKGCMNE